MARTLFFYFGDDEAYFKTLQAEFKQHSRMDIDFKHFYEKDEKKIQALYLKIYKLRPACVFIDFSKESQDYLHLARIIARTPQEHKMISVGLVDYLSPPEVLKESIATGVNLTHIKSAESYDVVFDVVKLLAPNEMGEHGFAKATLKENLEVGIPVKIGYVHGEGLHFETDFKLSPGQGLKLNHHWTEKKIVPSREIVVKDVETSNLFYHFKYAVDVDFIFVDEFVPVEETAADTIKEKNQERDAAIIYHKKQLAHWIEDNLSRSLEKKAKVLVIDHEFHFYQEQPRTDKHPYTIRCVPYLDDIGVELDRLQPQVIAYAMDAANGEARNTEENLKKLIAAAKAKFADEAPLFVIFNTAKTSKELQEATQYTHLMATGNELSVNILIRMADVFEKKMENLLQQMVGGKTKVLKKIFMKKTNSASISEILIPITVLKLSESDMLFQTEVELPIGMNLHFTKPVEMYVNVQPSKNQSKIPEYHGLINCLGEEEKKELRRYVNSIFFRDHDAQVTAESDEFKKLNETKLHEKEEASKIAKELSDASEGEIKSSPEEKTKASGT